MAVKDRVIFVPRGPRGQKGDQGEPGEGATSLTPRVEELENVRGRNLIYWNALTGNDANQGTSGYPVQTAQRVCEMLKANIANLIYLQSDVVWDYYLDATNYLKMQISGGPNDYFSVTFTDAINKTNVKAGIRTDSFATIVFLYSKIILAGIVDKPIFNAVIGKLKFRTFATNIELAPNSSGFLLSDSNGGELTTYFQGSNLINIQGKLFEGVGAGQDPNSRNLVYSNLASA